MCAAALTCFKHYACTLGEHKVFVLIVFISGIWDV